MTQYGKRTFDGSVVRLCVGDGNGVADVTCLTLDNWPDEVLAGFVANQRDGPALTLDRQEFVGAEKAEPALVYRRKSVATDPFTIVSETRFDPPLFSGALSARQRELDLQANSYRTTAADDPWFDSAVAAAVIAVQVRTVSENGSDDRILLVPVAGEDSPDETAARSLQMSNGIGREAWNWRPNFLPVPGNAMILAWVHNPEFRDAEAYAKAFSKAGTPTP